MKNKAVRLILAVLLSPPAACVPYLIFVIFEGSTAAGDIVRYHGDVFRILTLVSLFCVMLLGLPLYYMLERRGKRGVGYYILAGFLPPVLFSLSLGDWNHPPGPGEQSPMFEYLLFLLSFGSCGAIVAVVFWFVGVRPGKVEQIA